MTEKFKNMLKDLVGYGDGDNFKIDDDFQEFIKELKKLNVKEKELFLEGVNYLGNYFSEDGIITVTIDTLEAIDKTLYGLYVDAWFRSRNGNVGVGEEPACFEEFVDNERTLELNEQMEVYL